MSPDAGPTDATVDSLDGLSSSSDLALDSQASEGLVDAAPSDFTQDSVTSDGELRAYPPGPYGGFVGNTFAPFELTDCANRPYRFAGLEFSLSRATVVIFNAGYSALGRNLSAEVQISIVQPYRGHPIRVVEVLVEGEALREPATNAFCRAWVDAGRLGYPVLIDPTTMLGERVPQRAFPRVFLLDENSRIVWLSNNGLSAAGEARRELGRLVGEP